MTEPSPILGLKDVADQVAAMRSEVAVYKQGLQAEYERLNHEAEMQKKLSRYARRTWFEVLFWVFLMTVHLRDIASTIEYRSEWWGLVFVFGDTGSPWWIRALGAAWQIATAVILAKRSQVPDWIYERIPFAEEQRLQKRSRFR